MEDTSHQAHIEKKAKAALFTILFANFFRNLGISIIEIGLPNFVLSLAGTLTSFGIIMGVFSITQAIFQFPMARASDTFGRKRMILFGIVIYLIGTFLCYLAQDVIQLIIYRAIQGAGAYSSIIQAMISDYYRKIDEHGKGQGWFSFSFTIGFFGGIIIGGYISSYLGFRMIFIFSLFLGIISAILFLMFVKESDFHKNSLTSNGKNTIDSHIIKKDELKILIKEKEFNALVILVSLRWFLFSGIYVYFIWLVQIHFDLNQLEATYFLIFVTIIYTIFIILSGYWSDKYGSKKILIISQLLIIFSGVLIFISTDYSMFTILAIFIGVGFAMFQTSGYALLAKYIEQHHPDLKGTGFGYNNTISFFCGAFGPMYICFLGEISTFLPYYLVPFAIMITLLITFKYVKDTNSNAILIKTS